MQARTVPGAEAGGKGGSSPIDAFVDEKLRARGLERNGEASRRVLIRRAYYDLTGLPPTPEEVAAFERDLSPRAWENLVDRLLDSPRYGEKWGRHWLDLVRFAESNSYERDGAKPHTWRYRDYVIESFNADKPYDRFVREQLAGDELKDRDAAALVATGFYRLGIWDDEPADRELAKFDSLDDLVTTTGQVFLGLTVDCARCHHHKIDPISQGDYYRLLSFFQNINPYKNGGMTDELELPGGGKALGVSESGVVPPETFVLLRGNPGLKGDRVEPGFLQVLGGTNVTISGVEPGAKTLGRRTVLADWVVSEQNPLTARVFVNRLWQYHFGRGIVRSPNNFGLQGDMPTHAELLDWLAAELVRGGWRMKPMHRLIMNSAVYQMASSSNERMAKVDPGNDLLWRFEPRRLEAEEIRDSILAINGTLNLRMGGPGVYVDIPKEVMAGQSVPGQGWGTSTEAEKARRSVYIFVKRSLLTPILESFDLAETDRSAPVRFVTVQPTQALGMLNGAFLNRQAVLFADRLTREPGVGHEAKVRRALQLVTGREPSTVEVQRGVDLITALRTRDGMGDRAALEALCLMILNLNEMIYVD